MPIEQRGVDTIPEAERTSTPRDLVSILLGSIRRSRGGAYWYTAGWNLPATASWALGAAVGLCAVSLPSYQGPLLSLTGGVDCSFLLSGLVGGVAYTALTRGRHTMPAVSAGTKAQPSAVS